MANRNSDRGRVLKNTVLVNSAIVAEKGVFFAISILIARYLNIHDFGEYATSLGYATLFSSFVDLGINQALIRTINLEPEGRRSSFTSALILNVILSGLMYLMISFSLNFAGFSPDVVKLTLVFGFVRIISEMFKTIYAVFDAREEYNVFIYSTLLYSFLLFASTVFIITDQGDKFTFAYYRLLVTSVLMAILILCTIRYLDLKISFTKVIQFAARTTSFAIYALLMNLIQRSNIIMVALICGTTAAGIFNNSYLFFVTLLFIPGSLNRVLVPYLYKLDLNKSNQGCQSVFDTFSKISIVISFYLFIVFFLFAENITVLIFGAKYIEAAESLRILSVGIPAMFNIASVIITSLDRQKINSIIAAAVTIISIPLNIVLIKQFSINGAAVAVVLTFILIFCFSNLYLYQSGNISLNNFFRTGTSVLIVSVICIISGKILYPRLQFMPSLALISVLYMLFIIPLVAGENRLRVIVNAIASKVIHSFKTCPEILRPGAYELAKQKKN